MIAVTGYRTTIVQALDALVAEPIVRIDADLARFDTEFDIPASADRFVLAAGVLFGLDVGRLSGDQVAATVAVNFANVVRLCEQILTTRTHARIVVIGSESGWLGSFDRLYGASKAAVHQYVVTRPVSQHQQLAAVAPPIVSDSGMTRRRHDYPEVLQRRTSVTAKQVATVVRNVLYGETPVSGCVVTVPC